MNTIKNFLQNASPKLKALVFSGIFIFLAIIIISILLLLENQKSPQNINIINYAEILETTEYKNEVEEDIWLKLIDNSDSIILDGSKIYTANIRNDSFSSYISKDGTIRQNYIVDIDELQQSAAVAFYIEAKHDFFNSHPATPEITISCPYPSKVIYTDTKCLFDHPLDQLAGHLPYASWLSDGTQVRATERTYSSFQTFAGESYIAISVNSCGNREKMKEANQLIRSWLKSLNLDPNDYHIEVLDLCE